VCVCVCACVCVCDELGLLVLKIRHTFDSPLLSDTLQNGERLPAFSDILLNHQCPSL